MSIKAVDSGFYVALDFTEFPTPSGCMGSVKGHATLTKSILTLKGKDANDVGEICTIQIAFTEGKAAITEGDGCGTYHGTNCDFGRSMNRQK